MANSLKSSHRAFAILLTSLLLACGAVSAAQSGRQVRKPPPPVAEPAAAATPTPAAPATQPSLVLNVGMDQNNGFVNMPLHFYADALRTIVERLSKDSSFKVNDVGVITRGEAVQNAKKEKEVYVVYLELQVDTLKSDPFTQSAMDTILHYWVFAPGTAKIATSGHTYPRAYQSKGVVPRPNGSVTYDNYLINLAAKAAAEQMLDYFKRHRPADVKLPSPFGG